MWGSWERMIGPSRRILDAILLQDNIKLTHDVLCTHDGSVCNNQCQTPCSCVHWPRVTLHIISCNNTYPEGRGYPIAQRFHRQRSCQQTMETSPSPCRQILASLASGVPPHSASLPEIERFPPGPERRGHCAPERQSSRTQHVAYGKDHSCLSRERINKSANKNLRHSLC